MNREYGDPCQIEDDEHALRNATPVFTVEQKIDRREKDQRYSSCKRVDPYAGHSVNPPEGPREYERAEEHRSEDNHALNVVSLMVPRKPRPVLKPLTGLRGRKRAVLAQESIEHAANTDQPDQQHGDAGRAISAQKWKDPGCKDNKQQPSERISHIPNPGVPGSQRTKVTDLLGRPAIRSGLNESSDDPASRHDHDGKQA